MSAKENNTSAETENRGRSSYRSRDPGGDDREGITNKTAKAAVKKIELGKDNNGSPVVSMVVVAEQMTFSQVFHF